VPFFSVVIASGIHNKLEESSWMRIQSMRHMDVPSLTVQFVLPETMMLFTDKGCGESRGCRITPSGRRRRLRQQSIYNFLCCLIYTGQALPRM